MSALPNDLALTTIVDGSEIVASEHRNNYSAIQAAVNALRDALAGGNTDDVVLVVDSTHIELGKITNANVAAAAAIVLSKLAAGTQHTLLLSGASTVGSLAAGSSGQILVSGGSLADPAWTARGAIAATYNATPGDKATINGATLKMVGLAGSLTPTSTKAMFMVRGCALVDANEAKLALRYGTGSAPANDDALTGTAIGTDYDPADVGINGSPVEMFGIVSGLTPGTPYWFDAAIANTLGGHQCQLVQVTMTAFDIL